MKSYVPSMIEKILGAWNQKLRSQSYLGLIIKRGVRKVKASFIILRCMRLSTRVWCI